MYLRQSDVFGHIKRAQTAGKRVAVCVLAREHEVEPDALTLHDVSYELLTILSPGYAFSAPRAIELAAQEHDVVYLLTASSSDESVWTLVYGGQPIASAADVEFALADGTVEVRHGELWCESPIGSGLWSFVGVVLESAADALRAAGVPLES